MSTAERVEQRIDAVKGFENARAERVSVPMSVDSTIGVAIIGAGPYGLSIAAQLRERGVPFRIFGFAMETWRTHMPAGMRLKSDGFASNLYVGSGYSLKTYCAERQLSYDDLRIPVALDTFVAYGAAFQRRYVPTLEEKRVVALARRGAAFRLTLDDGERVAADRVVVACGINDFAHLPPELADLDPSVCSHTCAHRDLSVFRGKRVAVVGGGASALDVAAILHRHGAAVAIVSRHPLEFHAPPGPRPRPLWARLRHPHLGLGVSLRSAICTLFPNLFRHLPRRLRHAIVRTHLGPAGGWFVRDDVIGKAAIHSGYSLRGARADAHGVELRCADASGAPLTLHVDHIIAGTGYKVDLHRLEFIDRSVSSGIRTEDGSPVLSANFESSLPGLYFVGGAAAATFGPLLRFALGARFTAGRLAAHLARTARSAPRRNR